MLSEHLFQKEITVTKEVELAYLLSLPTDYNDNEKEFPLLLFLHGMGERGNDLELVKRHCPLKLAEKQSFPFILLAPQCPLELSYSTWALYLDDLMALIDHISTVYRVDAQKIYVTGLSMGGYGTWELAKKYPDRFAAAAPICGGGSIKGIERLKDVPVWAFHGEKDDVVPLDEGEKMVQALQDVGGNVKLTVYPDAAHDSWTDTYRNPDLYTWLLQQEKK